MALDDWTVINTEKRAGGQGYVQNVQHKRDGRTGALKRLHGAFAEQTERRYRFLVEVSGLRALEGDGVPRVLEANDDRWQERDVELYVVMEFVDGPTLTHHVQSSNPTLDDSLACTIRILSILAAGHALPLHHRDLKPDNVIVRSGEWSDPVLVDLGIAWHGAVESGGFETPDGKELGNRFLRVPEFAPGGLHKDPRSDLAMAAGLLFFMLSGGAPRSLLDHEGRYPHEVVPSPIRPEVLSDPRWPRLSQVLRVAFQQRIDHRFRDAQEFITRLSDVNGVQTLQDDDLEAEFARLKELTESAVARERAEAAPGMDKANNALCRTLTVTWASAGLVWGGQNPVFSDAGARNSFYCVVSRQGHTDPHVFFRHSIELREGRLVASWQLDQSAPTVFYDGPASDHDALDSALQASARKLAAVVVRALNDKLQPAGDLTSFLK